MTALLRSPAVETWPRWLPTPTLHDLCVHFVESRGDRAECGALVMWVEPEHPTTTRPRCPTCAAVAGRVDLGRE